MRWLLFQGIWVPVPVSIRKLTTGSPVPRGAMPSDLCGHKVHKWYLDMHAGKTLKHIKKLTGFQPGRNKSKSRHGCLVTIVTPAQMCTESLGKPGLCCTRTILVARRTLH